MAKEKHRSHPPAPLYYPGTAPVLNADQVAGALELSFDQLIDQINDIQVPESAISQHTYTDTEIDALFAALAASDLADWPANVVGFLKNDGAGVLTWSSSAATVAALDDVGDVNATTPSDGDVLTWDSGTSTWIPAAPSGGIAALDDIGDVNAPTPADGDVLSWDSGTSMWVPVAGGSGTVGGTGTAGTLPKWSASTTLADSLLSESGTEMTVNGSLVADLFESSGWDANLDEAGDTGRFLTRASIIRVANGGVLKLGRVNGTAASPTAILSGEALGVMQFRGWDGSTLSSSGSMTALATENWSGSARGCEYRFATVPNGATAAVNNLIVANTGIVTMPRSRKEGLLAADMSGFTNSNTDITSMVFDVQPNEVWVASYFLWFVTSGSTAGCLFNFTVPVGTTGEFLTEGCGGNLSTRVGSIQTTITGNSGAVGTGTGITGFAHIEALIEVGANAGNVQLRGLSGGGTTTITMQRGSRFHARRIS